MSILTLAKAERIDRLSSDDAAAEEYRSQLQERAKDLLPETVSEFETELALYLLYGSPDPGPADEESLIIPSKLNPDNATEASSLLLSAIHRKWDKRVAAHLFFALQASNQKETAVKMYEMATNDDITIEEKWFQLARCHAAIGSQQVAMICLRKVLGPSFSPSHIGALFLAARLCAGIPTLATEGSRLSERLVELLKSQSTNEKRALGYHLLAVNLGTQARVPQSVESRQRLREKAGAALRSALEASKTAEGAVFDLALLLAEQRNIGAALRVLKGLIKGSVKPPGDTWRLLALLLTSQRRWAEAGQVCESILKEESNARRKSTILKLRARIYSETGDAKESLNCHTNRLLLVTELRNSGIGRKQANEMEGEVWEDLAVVYSSTCQWPDAEECVEKAKKLRPHSASAWHTAGLVLERSGKEEAALDAYETALGMDPDFSPSLIRLGFINLKHGRGLVSMADVCFSQAVRVDPSNYEAWNGMALVGELQGTPNSVDCRAAGEAFRDSNPALPFSDLAWAI